MIQKLLKVKRGLALSERSESKGFTLIELLVVIAIIVIIASLIIVNLATARTKARDSKRFQDLDTIRTVIESYMDDNNGSTPGTAISYNSCVPSEWDALQSILSPTYIAVLPVDPRNSCGFSPGQRYFYVRTATQYELNTILESPTNRDKSQNDGGNRNNCSTMPFWQCQYELGNPQLYN